MLHSLWDWSHTAKRSRSSMWKSNLCWRRYRSYLSRVWMILFHSFDIRYIYRFMVESLSMPLMAGSKIRIVFTAWCDGAQGTSGHLLGFYGYGAWLILNCMGCYSMLLIINMNNCKLVYLMASTIISIGDSGEARRTIYMLFATLRGNMPC